MSPRATRYDNAGYTVFQDAPEEEDAGDAPLIIAETRVEHPRCQRVGCGDDARPAQHGGAAVQEFARRVRTIWCIAAATGRSAGSSPRAADDDGRRHGAGIVVDVPRHASGEGKCSTSVCMISVICCRPTASFRTSPWPTRRQLFQQLGSARGAANSASMRATSPNGSRLANSWGRRDSAAASRCPMRRCRGSTMSSACSSVWRSPIDFRCGRRTARRSGLRAVFATRCRGGASEGAGAGLAADARSRVPRQAARRRIEGCAVRAVHARMRPVMLPERRARCGWAQGEARPFPRAGIALCRGADQPAVRIAADDRPSRASRGSISRSTNAISMPRGAAHGTSYFKMLDDAAFYAANSLVTDRFLLTTAFNLLFTRPLGAGSGHRRRTLGQRQAAGVRGRCPADRRRWRGSRAGHGHVHAIADPAGRTARLSRRMSAGCRRHILVTRAAAPRQ